MAKFIEVAPDVWVNNGEGSIQMVTVDNGFVHKENAMVQLTFGSGYARTLPRGIKIEDVINKLNEGDLP